MTHCNLNYNSDVRIIVTLHQYISNKHNSEVFGISCYNLTTKKTKNRKKQQKGTTTSAPDKQPEHNQQEARHIWFEQRKW